MDTCTKIWRFSYKEKISQYVDYKINFMILIIYIKNKIFVSVINNMSKFLKIFSSKKIYTSNTFYSVLHEYLDTKYTLNLSL